MSIDSFDDNDDNEPSKRVTDEEGTVDQKLKSRIIQARKRVDEREDDVFVGEPLMPDVALTDGEKLEMWGTSVRQYLKSVEPLLQSSEVEQSRYYYHEVEIVDEPVYPPDGRTKVWGNEPEAEIWKIPWSLFYEDDFTVHKYADGDLPIDRGFEPPEPKRAQLYGLKDVIETDRFEFHWSVVLNPQDIPPQQNTAKPSVTLPLRKQWLESAVRKADSFLQEAGVGLEIGHQQTDDKDDDPF
jgi:hypothetical protein